MKGLLLFVMAAWVGTSTVARGESALNPTCYKLYEMFNLPNLSYEDVGKIADKMHENTCWPVLQGVEIGEAPAEQSLPAITDCSSLAPHIVQMTQNQATESNPAIIKLYGVKTLDQETCGAYFFKHPDGWLGFLAGTTPAKRFFKACGRAMGASTEGLFPSQPGDPVAVLDCMGTARYTFGYAQDEPRYFYLERFPDGEEFFGVSPLTQ